MMHNWSNRACVAPQNVSTLALSYLMSCTSGISSLSGLRIFLSCSPYLLANLVLAQLFIHHDLPIYLHPALRDVCHKLLEFLYSALLGDWLMWRGILWEGIITSTRCGDSGQRVGVDGAVLMLCETWDRVVLIWGPGYWFGHVNMW